MPKERNFNPVQAQRKADKAKAIKKGKADLVSRRNEKLAKRNPARIQKQIDDLKAIASGGGTLTKHEEEVLEGLERDLRAVNKARETLGDKAPEFGRDGAYRNRDGDGVLGKRRRGRDGASSSDEDDVPEDVRRIPMPRDTPPPIAKQVLDEWYAKRRARRNANLEPLGERAAERAGGRGDRSEPAPPLVAVEAKTVYEAKPIVRDLRKEAVSAFVPTAVRMKVDKAKGNSGLLEPEEADKLEQEGYLASVKVADVERGHGEGSQELATSRTVTMEEVEDEEG